MGAILSAINVNKDTSYQSINAKPMVTISARMFQREPNYSQHCNQSGVSISADIFTNIYMLHFKFLYVFTILRRYISSYLSLSQYVASLVALQVFTYLRIRALRFTTQFI